MTTTKDDDDDDLLLLLLLPFHILFVLLLLLLLSFSSITPILYFLTSTQDRFLPIANISRIMKNLLPENAKIAKESKEAVQETVSEFISFITSEASDKCLQEKRKTINGDDLLWAMSTLGFDRYVEPLKIYLNKYREAVRGDKPLKQQPPAAAAASSSSGGVGSTGGRLPREGGNCSSGTSGANPVGRPSALASLAGEGIGVPPNKKPKYHAEEDREGGGL
jgi:nuclear transcription Y subunit beta